MRQTGKFGLAPSGSKENAPQRSTERRSRQRFHIEQDVRYTCLSEKHTSGTGRLLDISSKGIRFTTQRGLTPGTLVEVSMNWPALLDDTCGLKLTIYGVVVRSDPSFAAARIEQYEFRTRASRPLPVLPDPPACPKVP